MRMDKYAAVRASFDEAWPYNYGSKEINSKSDESVKKHRLAYDGLIEAVWPAFTWEKYFALEGFPPRAKFHVERLEACVGKSVLHISKNRK